MKNERDFNILKIMQILLRIPEELVPETNIVSPELRARANKDYGIQKADEVRLVNIGLGADWMVYLAIFNVTWTLFPASWNHKRQFSWLAMACGID